MANKNENEKSKPAQSEFKVAKTADVIKAIKKLIRNILKRLKS